MRPVTLLLILLFSACSAPEEAKRVRSATGFLREHYGYAPSGSRLEERDLRDLVEREALCESLHTPECRAFGERLVSLTGYAFEPKHADALVSAANGPPGKALADPEVARLLASLRDDDLLSEVAGLDTIRLTANGVAALRSVPEERIRALARSLPYRFLPSDAPFLLEPFEPFGEAGSRFLTRLVTRLRAEIRPRYLADLHAVAAHREETKALLRLADRGEVDLLGTPTFRVLARLVGNYQPLDAAGEERFLALVTRTAWPNARDFQFLVPLAQAEGVVELVDRLDARYGYRLEPSHAAELIRLLREGMVEPDLPAWIVEDRPPLARPGELLSADPVRAFADRNDLMMDVSRSRESLVAKVLRRLEGVEVVYRMDSAYSEDVGDLGRFLRPDLVKVILLLDLLDDPEVVERILGWMDEDLRDRASETGGWVRLSEGRFVLDRYEGAARSGRDDRLYLTPDPEGAALEFHFHATDEDDAEYAGPSGGRRGTDLSRAARHRTDGVVFTRLAGRRFDTDFYTSRGMVLDLGVRGGR